MLQISQDLGFMDGEDPVYRFYLDYHGAVHHEVSSVSASNHSRLVVDGNQGLATHGQARIAKLPIKTLLVR